MILLAQSGQACSEGADLHPTPPIRNSPQSPPPLPQLVAVAKILHCSAGQPWPSLTLAYYQCRVTDGCHPIQDYRGLPEAQNDSTTLGQIGSKGKDLSATSPVLAQQGFWRKFGPQQGSQAHQVKGLATVTMTAGPANHEPYRTHSKPASSLN